MKNYYKVSLCDDMDTRENRGLLNKQAILSTNFFTEIQLNNKLTRFIEKYSCPFLLTAIQVSEYSFNEDSGDSEMVGFVSFSELNERLKSVNVLPGDSVEIYTSAIFQKTQPPLNGFKGVVEKVVDNNTIYVSVLPLGTIQFSRNELLKTN